MNNNQEPSVDTPTSEMPTDEQFVTTSVETKKEIDNNFFKSRSFKLIIGISVILLLVIAGSFTYLWLTGEDSSLTTEIGEDTTSVESRSFNMTKFQSDEEFNEYFEESFASAFFGVDLLNVEIPNTGVDLGPQGQFGNLEESRSADRFSGTNVQVSSIDEPDILKSDGENIYFSGNNFGVIQPFIGLESRVAPDIPEQSDPGTRVVQVFPPQNIEGISTIDHRGEMLLSGNNLVIFASNRIVGYNVEDKTNPSQSWSLALDQEDNRRTRVVTSKLYNDNIYVVTGSRVRGDNPCPIPVFSGSSEMTVPCVDVFRPNIDTDVDSTYTVMKINPQNGVVENSISFVGSARESVVYMSENSIYVTSNSRQDEFDIFSGFFLNEMNDLLPDELIEKMKQISEYDISNESKFMEYQLNLEKHLTTL